MPLQDDACSGAPGQNRQQQPTAPLLMKVKLGRPRKGTVAPTACLSEDDKKGRRRAANRESARRMRARRAQNVAQLTDQVEELKSKCERLQSNNQAIRLNWKKVALENHRLRAQFLALQTGSGGAAAPFTMPPPASPPPEIDEDAMVPPFDDDDSPLSMGQTSSTNETDLLSCLTPGFHSSPNPSSQPAVTSPGAQQVPQLPASFTPPCSPTTSEALLPHSSVSPFATSASQPDAAPPAPAPRSTTSSSAPRLKINAPPAPHNASLAPQWGLTNPTLQQAMPSVTHTNTNTTSHGTVILDPHPTVNSSTAPTLSSQSQPTSQAPSYTLLPPRFSHPLTLRTDLYPDHACNPPTSHPHHPHHNPAPWTTPASNPLTLDPLDPSFPWPPHNPPNTLPPHLTCPPPARSFSKSLDPMPSLNPNSRSFSKQLEAMPSLGPGGDPLQRLINSWDILQCLPPHRQHSLDPMASMGSLPLLDDHPGLLAPPDLHLTQGQAPDDSPVGQVPILPKMSTPPMFFR